MNLKKIIKTFYIVYTIYVLLVIDITNMTFFNTFPAIFIMWTIYIFFSLGYRGEKIKKDGKLKELTVQPWLLNQKKRVLFLIAFSSMLFSILAANYYTGQNPTSIINGLVNGNSLYYEYQDYFSIQQISTFSLLKLPYVFMLFYIKFVLFYSFIAFFLSEGKIKLYEKIYLFYITLSHVYFGIARGTNFEVFELIILIIFLLLIKSNNKKRLVKNFIISFIVGCVMIFIYYNVVTARGFIFSSNISRDIFYNPKGVLPMLSPMFGFIILMLFDYLGFGFFYIATYTNDIWLPSISNFFIGLIPLGFKSINNISIQSIMKTHIDMGARWTPDIIITINNFGFIGLLFICFFLGSFAKNSYKNDKGMLFYVTNYIILLEMISLPIGNFLFASSASVLIIVTLISIWLWKYFIKVKITM